MNLRAVIRGTSLEEMQAKAQTVCQQFYGTQAYEIVYQSWQNATAETFAADGTVTGFMMDVEAHPVVV